MSTNEYPVFFQSQLLGTSAQALYTVPMPQSLQDLQIKLTNTSGTAVAATVYVVQDPTDNKATGTHDGSDNVAVLDDSTASWEVNQWIGYKVKNTTDVSEGEITANTATTVTATLAGGTDDDWDGTDNYEIVHMPSKLNEVFPATSIPANDYLLVPIERAASSSVIYAQAATANVVNIQCIGGKLHTG